MRPWIMLAVVLGAAAAQAHPGRTAADGCHTDRKAGGRHCHNVAPAPRRPVAQPAPAPAKAKARKPGPTKKAEGRLPVGDAATRLYYLPGCRGYDKIDPTYWQHFESAEQAEAAGYTRHPRCPGPKRAVRPAAAKHTERASAWRPPGPLRGDAATRLYYLPACRDYEHAHSVEFPSKEAAVSAGYKLAYTCELDLRGAGIVH